MSPREKENTERVSTFLPADTVDALKEEAAEKGLTVSSLIRMVLLEHVREEWRNKPFEPPPKPLFRIPPRKKK